MASLASRSGGATLQLEQDEACPVCKTTRYFNKDMEFRINPECYHRMCKSCVDRIFRDGPNQCPYAGCHKTLRLRGFKAAFFSDLNVEREVDIRRRVAAVFNKVEEDFETLDDWNEYLEMVETLTTDIVGGRDDERQAAEAQLMEWEARHKAEIERNRKLARESEDARQKRVAAERDAARRRRLRDIQDEADEKANAKKFKEEMLDGLMNAERGKVGETLKSITLKKRGQQKRDAAVEAARASSSGGGLSIRGLRDTSRRDAPVEVGPYDPFGGLSMLPQRVDVSEERLAEYSNEAVDKARHKDAYVVGGYSADEYLTRAVFEAFSGLGVFVDDEKADRAVSTAGAAQAASTGVTTGSMVDVLMNRTEE